MTPIIIIGRSENNELPDEDAWANAGVEKNISMPVMTKSLFMVFPFIVCKYKSFLSNDKLVQHSPSIYLMTTLLPVLVSIKDIIVC